MGFLSPWFLGGLLAAGLPIYIHLLRQHKSEPVKFSSAMFLERRTQSSVKHRRLKYIALFSLRLLIILLLAVLFANPFIRRSVSASGGRKFVPVLVDNSFSMRTGDRMGRAKQAALDAISTMGNGDRGQVMSFASNVQLLTAPTSDKAELQRAVQGIQPGDGRSAYGEVSRTLRSLGQPDGLPVEAHVISDMQQTSMPTPFAELALPPSLRLQLHSTADKPEGNWFVESVTVPRSVFQANRVRVQAVIAGAGTPAADTSVELVVNGRTLETKKASIPESGRTTVEFYIPDVGYGVNRGEVRIPAKDALARDDRFLFSVERKESSRILFVSFDARGPRSATYYRAAIESVPNAGYTVEAVSGDQAANLSPDKFSAVVLSDPGSVSSGFEAALSAYVKRGGGVLIALGSQAAARGRVPITGDEIQQARYASREGERFLAAGSVDRSHPATARSGSLEAVRFYQTVNLDAGKARVIAKLSDGSPLLYEKQIGEGRVLVLTSTLDNIANDLPLHAAFIPLMEQIAHYLSGFDPAPALYPVDSFVELRSARDGGSAVDVVDPDGNRALSLKDSATAQSFRLNREGFFELRRANGRNEAIAVHADRRESDLQLIPKETLALWQGTGTRSEAPSSASDSGQKPYSLWWYFALALLIASIAESLFASRYLAAEQNAGPAVQKRAA